MHLKSFFVLLPVSLFVLASAWGCGDKCTTCKPSTGPSKFIATEEAAGATSETGLRTMTSEARATNARLTEVASFGTRQPTGVAVSHSGRIFVSFPNWSGSMHDMSLAELTTDGNVRPYPNVDWNIWGEGADAKTHFVSVQSVFVDPFGPDHLWVLDTGNPDMKGTVAGGAKLLRIDLATDKIVQTYTFDDSAAPSKSYLNDVRADDKFAYITDSGMPGLVILDLSSGKAKRVLENDASTTAVKDFAIGVNGKQVKDSTGKSPQVNADGIALTADHQWLYYKPMSSNQLYRIQTSALQQLAGWQTPDADKSAAKSDAKPERVAPVGATDGLAIDRADNLYITSVENNAITRMRPDGTMTTVVQDTKLRWPDSIAIGSDGTLFITDSQLQYSPRFTDGKGNFQGSFKLYRIGNFRANMAMARPDMSTEKASGKTEKKDVYFKPTGEDK